MALSDSVRGKERTRTKNRAVSADSNYSWSDKQKMEAVKSYLLLGNVALVSRILNIPEVTIRYWRRSEWWAACIEDIRTQEKVELSGKLKTIVEKSLEAVEDRLLNGDFVLNQKTGQMERKQVNMKDAHKVATDLIDRKALLDKTGPAVATEQGDDERLLKLAEKFATFVTQKLDKPKEELELVEDITPKEDTDAVHDQRKT